MDGVNDSLDTVNITSVFSADKYVRYIVVVSYLTTFLFGFVGNCLVIYIIGHFTSERVKSVANYYIWSLAFADLTFVLSLPLFGWSTLVEHWPLSGTLGDISCKMAYVCRDVARFASAWTMIALSVDRSLASSLSTRKLRPIRSGKIVIAVTWICSFLLSLHYFIIAQTVDGKCVMCASPLYGYTWTVIHMSLGYVMPSIVIYTSYCVLWQKIRSRPMTRHGSNSSMSRSSRSMTRTVLIVVVTFTLCQTPYHLVQIITMVPPSHENMVDQYQYERSIAYANAVGQILVFVASCCNPIIYGLTNFNFRRLYITALYGCCNVCCPMERSHPTTSTQRNCAANESGGAGRYSIDGGDVRDRQTQTNDISNLGPLLPSNHTIAEQYTLPSV